MKITEETRPMTTEHKLTRVLRLTISIMQIVITAVCGYASIVFLLASVDNRDTYLLVAALFTFLIMLKVLSMTGSSKKESK